MAKKHHRCDKFATQKSFNNLQNGSQDFSKATIRSPSIVTSFINSGSGSQDFKRLKIECDDKSIWQRFEDVARFGIAKLFNYEGNGSQTFPAFNFFKYLQNLAKGWKVPYIFISLHQYLVNLLHYGNTMFFFFLSLLHLFLFYST